MKKLVCMILVVLMAAVCAMSCADEMLAGGWNVTDDLTLTEEARAAFEKANGGYEGTPVALLGTQVVAGINYAVLVRDSSGYEIYYVYQNLEGEAILVDVAPVKLGMYETDDLLTEEDGQNPTMNFIGTYYDINSERATLLIEAVGSGNEALLTVDWANGASEGYTWVFPCVFDTETNAFVFENGVKKEWKADDSGNVTETVLAENLKGYFQVENEDNNEFLLWIIEGEDAGNDCRFVWPA